MEAFSCGCSWYWLVVHCNSTDLLHSGQRDYVTPDGRLCEERWLNGIVTRSHSHDR